MEVAVVSITHALRGVGTDEGSDKEQEWRGEKAQTESCLQESRGGQPGEEAFQARHMIGERGQEAKADGLRERELKDGGGDTRLEGEAEFRVVLLNEEARQVAGVQRGGSDEITVGDDEMLDGVLPEEVNPTEGKQNGGGGQGRERRGDGELVAATPVAEPG